MLGLELLVEEKTTALKELLLYIEGKIEPNLEEKSIELLDKAEAEFTKREAIIAVSISLLEKVEEREGKLDRFLNNIEQYIADKVVNEKSQPQPGFEIWRQNSVS